MTPTPEMPMTPEERTKKTIQLISAYLGQPPHELPFSDGKQTHEIVAAQIREAEKEALELGFNNGLKCENRHHAGSPFCPECFEGGFNAAKEKAAEICHSAADPSKYPNSQSPISMSAIAEILEKAVRAMEA